jgi:hypothetical protein
MTTRLDYLQELEDTLPLIARQYNTSMECRTSVPYSLLQESLHGVWSEYNSAIVNNLLGLQRHIFVLRAWNDVLERFGEADDVRISVVIDFVEPTLFRARDLPGAIREQCHQCAGKMTYLFNSGDETLDYVRNPNKNSSDWRRYHDEQHLSCDEYDEFRRCLSSLHEKVDDDAKRLALSHGQRHHDIATIVEMQRHVPKVWQEGGGIGYGYVVDEVKLADEIPVLDKQREHAYKAYTALSTYLDQIYDAHIVDLQNKGYAITRC